MKTWANRLLKIDETYLYKPSYSLLRRLSTYLLDNNYLQRGLPIADPCAGVGAIAVGLADTFPVLCVCQNEHLMFATKNNIEYNKWINEKTIKDGLVYNPKVIYNSSYHFKSVLIAQKIRTNYIYGFITCPEWLGNDRINDFRHWWTESLIEMYYGCANIATMAIITNEVAYGEFIVDVPSILQKILEDATRWNVVEIIHSYFDSEPAEQLSFLEESSIVKQRKINKDVIIIARKEEGGEGREGQRKGCLLWGGGGGIRAS